MQMNDRYGINLLIYSHIPIKHTVIEKVNVINLKNEVLDNLRRLLNKSPSGKSD